MLPRAAALLATALVLGTVANALSPRGLSWTRPLGDGLRAQAARAGLLPIGLAEMRRLPPEVLLLDSRPPEEFSIGRLPGAVSMPPEKNLTAPPGRPIVVYCANEFCESSLRLGERLVAAGHRNVALFVEGYEAWWNAGGPVDQD